MSINLEWNASHRSMLLHLPFSGMVWSSLYIIYIGKKVVTNPRMYPNLPTPCTTIPTIGITIGITIKNRVTDHKQRGLLKIKPHQYGTDK